MLRVEAFARKQSAVMKVADTFEVLISDEHPHPVTDRVLRIRLQHVAEGGIDDPREPSGAVRWVHYSPEIVSDF